MGILRDWGILIGILPIPRLEPVEFKGRIGDEVIDKTACEKLEELNGQNVWIRDFHYGILSGRLKYIPLFTDKYILSNCNGTDDSKMLHIHDLETIF